MSQYKPIYKVLLVSMDAKYIHSNLALRYLEAYYVEHYQHTYPVEFCRKEYTINQQVAHIVADIYEEKADIIGFSCYIWNIEHVKKIIRNLKKVMPGVKLILGGPEVSFDSADCMRQYPEIDFIVCGEGEQAFAELVSMLASEQRKMPAGVKNISYRDSDASDGKIVEATQQGRVDDLANVPSAYADDFDAEQFAHRIIYYEASRGCPYSCQYCLSSNERGVRFFPLERVKEDLLRFINAGVKQVKFVDRTFNCAPRFAMEIFEWIVEHHQGKTNFHFEISADLLTEEMIAFLHTVPHGLFQFEIGVQSTHEDTLSEIQRRTNLHQLKKAVAGIRNGGNIHQHLDLIVGLPNEDYRTFARSFNEVYQMQPDQLQMGFLKLLKGSGLRRREQEYRYVYSDEAPYEVMACDSLQYEEIIQLKEIEHLLDHYYNSHQFDMSLRFLIDQLGYQPFDFYEQMAVFCKQRGFYGRAHSQSVMYQYIFDFACDRLVDEERIDRFVEIMRFDFTRLGPHGRLPECLREYQPDDYKKHKQMLLSDVELQVEYFSQYRHLNMRNLTQHVRIEVFKYDILGDHSERESWYLFVYHDDPLQFRRADWHDITRHHAVQCII